MMRKAIFALVVIVAGASVWLVLRNRARDVTVRSYFHNAQGLRRRAKVRANGIDVGSVKDVILSPHAGEQPVEVLLRLDGRYAARIPSDSTATIETEGVLGPPYVEIDVSKATGNPVGNSGILKGVDSVPVTQFFLNAMGEQTKRLAAESEKLRQTIDSASPGSKK